MKFAEYLAARGFKWRPCYPSCAGLFRDTASGRWQRCDDCAKRSSRRADRDWSRYDDSHARDYVRLLSSGARRGRNAAIFALAAVDNAHHSMGA